MLSVIIPDRGDRPRFTEHALYQLQRNINYSQIDIDVVHVNYPANGNTPDLTERVREGLKMAKFEYVTIWENDDYYPDNYLGIVSNRMMYHAQGYEHTIYYHILENRHKDLLHPGRSSLFCTSFRKSILDNFKWPADDYVFLDLDIWKHIQQIPSLSAIFSPGYCAIGIKHGQGLCGGMGHRNGYKFINKDLDYKWLKDHVRKESYEFYLDIASELKK